MSSIGDWPDFYPKNFQIPPKGSQDASGEFFRLVRELNPLSPSSFLATHEEQPKKHLSFSDKNEIINVYGVSFWATKESIIRKRKSLPNALGKMKIAQGTLSPTMGKIMKTGDEHHYTAWLKKACGVHLNFSRIENE